jgi:hypothetical protein
MRGACRTLLALAVFAAVTADAPAAEPPAVTCSAERPSVGYGGATRLNAWAAPAAATAPTYRWEVTAGTLDGAGAHPGWSFADVRPGTYAAIVHVRLGGAESECLVRVIVRRDAAERKLPGAPSRETASAFLLPEQAETAGYGLYTYLLLGAPPTDASRERAVRALAAFSILIPDVASLEQYVPRAELNVAYIPLRQAPAGGTTAETLLATYDYARARSLLRRAPGSTRDGPYILSVLQPMSAGATSGPYLFQDLSRVPPHLVETWAKEFLAQAAQERFWEPRTGERMALKLRLTVGVLGAGLPEVHKALDTWIAWTH